MSRDPQQDMVTFLDTNVSSITEDVDLFVGPVRADDSFIPKNAVFVTGDAGEGPQRDMAESSELKRPLVVVFVRNDSRKDGYTLASTIQDTVQGASISGYEDVYSINSQPSMTRYTDKGLLLYVIKFRMVLDE